MRATTNIHGLLEKPSLFSNFFANTTSEVVFYSKPASYGADSGKTQATRLTSCPFKTEVVDDSSMVTCLVCLFCTALVHIVSDYVADFVMSSLKTCTVNCGSRWVGEGKGGSKGWAVDHQPGMSVDGHSHHDQQKGDFQVSKKGVVCCAKKGEQGGNWLTEQYSRSAVHVRVVATCVHI